jgi:hypothetical protein
VKRLSISLFWRRKQQQPSFVTSVVFVALVCEGTDSLREELLVIINHRRERERERKKGF